MRERWSEADRLAALRGYGILDTATGDVFDDFVQIAAMVCEAPIAVVNLIDETRQWFAAEIGLGVRETPLSVSICAHAILQSGVFVVPDLTKDSRFDCNPLVTGDPKLRFYGGALLETPEGLPLGTMCVLDYKARPEGLTERQEFTLNALARQVMTQLELRRSMITLEARVTKSAQERSRTWQVSPDLIGVLNKDGVFESSNPAWQRLLGWSAAEISSRVFFDFLHPDDLPKNHAAWKDALLGEPVLNFENRYRCKDGTYRWLSWVAVPEGDKVYCSARDITFSKTLQESSAAFEASLLDERATSALREQFIAVLGHDLRNPLAAIDGGTHLLRGMALNDRAAIVVDMIQKSTVRMAGLIDNVMDFARGRLGGGLTLTRVSEPIEPMLRQVIAELRTGARNRVIDATFDLPDAIDCDQRRVGQLLSNLLGNALTHGASDKPIKIVGSMTVNWFRLSVTNSGAPIPAVALKQIFQPFTRGVLGASKQGLGLGLYIAHQIAVAHGGRIDVVSTTAGTRFTFRMPLHL